MSTPGLAYSVTWPTHPDLTTATDAERDLDDWYRNQHLDMLSMVRGYVRSTRYRLVRGLVEYPGVRE